MTRGRITIPPRKLNNAGRLGRPSDRSKRNEAAKASAGRTVTVYHRQHTTRHKQTVRQRACKRDNERA
ncbi:uncharacterized protein LOC122531411 isoform X2 [Frieseomelitta varia]|uniref:uncharacterized protein LOC122531411 isoform X2 n=1 Tax=Frieseomelitta varia TaxID=561572 RepID=UPI001CB6A785|nr:uncharacterized protein LOC122531411 isoform X2 [Frieseomelitta varia]